MLQQLLEHLAWHCKHTRPQERQLGLQHCLTQRLHCDTCIVIVSKSERFDCNKEASSASSVRLTRVLRPVMQAAEKAAERTKDAMLVLDVRRREKKLLRATGQRNDGGYSTMPTA